MERRFYRQVGFWFLPIGGMLVFLGWLVQSAYWPVEKKVLWPVRLGQRWGYVNEHGQVAIGFQYRSAEAFDRNGLALVQNEQKQFGWINHQNQEVIPCQWDACTVFSPDGFSLVMKNDRTGVLNTKGEQTIPVQYFVTNAERFWPNRQAFFDKNGHIILGSQTGFGWIDQQGKELLPMKWQSCESFDEQGLAVVFRDKYGVIRRDGSEVLKCEWDNVQVWKRAILVSKNSKWGIMNVEGKVVHPPQWDEIIGNDDDTLLVVRQGKYGWIDVTGKMVLEPRWEGAYTFANGLASVRKDEKYGCIDKSGKLIIEHLYDEPVIFRRADRAIVCKEKKYGMIDRTGKVIIPIELNACYESDEHDYLTVSLVGSKGQYSFLDQNNQSVDKSIGLQNSRPADKFQTMTRRAMELSTSPATTDDKVGLVQGVDKVIIPFEWRWIAPLKDGKANEVYRCVREEEWLPKPIVSLVEAGYKMVGTQRLPSSVQAIIDPQGKTIWHSHFWINSYRTICYWLAGLCFAFGMVWLWRLWRHARLRRLLQA